jgi:magnesium-transporting ATPase (P-type)
MLTGDKHSTAVQIALACNFILPEPEGQLLQVQGRSSNEVRISLERVLRTLRITGTEHKVTHDTGLLSLLVHFLVTISDAHAFL